MDNHDYRVGNSSVQVNTRTHRLCNMCKLHGLNCSHSMLSYMYWYVTGGFTVLIWLYVKLFYVQR